MDEGRNASPTGHDEKAAWIYVIDRSFECCRGLQPASESYWRSKMAIRDLLLTEFDEEMKKTRTMLERVLDEGGAKVRQALQNMSEEAWKENWKLSLHGKTIFEGSRFLAYREMFLNHVVHHRAQLGVYLRLNEKPVPSTYGPSADETMGF